MSDELRLAMAALRSADREIVALQARVELLTAALTKIANRACVGPDVEDCGDEHVDLDAWCDRCKARAALAAGVADG